MTCCNQLLLPVVVRVLQLFDIELCFQGEVDLFLLWFPPLQVVLIHGFPNFWYVWKNQFQALAEAGYHVVAPDLRGYNTSSKPKSI